DVRLAAGVDGRVADVRLRVVEAGLVDDDHDEAAGDGGGRAGRGAADRELEELLGRERLHGDAAARPDVRVVVDRGGDVLVDDVDDRRDRDAGSGEAERDGARGVDQVRVVLG